MSAYVTCTPVFGGIVVDVADGSILFIHGVENLAREDTLQGVDDVDQGLGCIQDAWRGGVSGVVADLVLREHGGELWLKFSREEHVGGSSHRCVLAFGALK